MSDAINQRTPSSCESTRRASSWVSTVGNLAGRLARSTSSSQGQLHIQHVLVQVQQRRQGLVLGRRGHIKVARQVGQKQRHFLGTHVAGMALVVEKYEPLDSANVDLLGAKAVSAPTQ